MHTSLLLAAALSATPVELSTLDGKQTTGDLAGITSSAVSVAGQDAVPLKNVMHVSFPQHKPSTDPPQGIAVGLADGSLLYCENVLSEAKQATLASKILGELKLDSASIAHLRFADLDSKVGPKWAELLERGAKRDLMVVRKGDVLDYLQGVVGNISQEEVSFDLGGNAFPIKREKVFGIVYTRSQTPSAKPVCKISMTAGDSLLVQSVTWVDGKLVGKLLNGVSVTVPVESVSLLDFSLGKVLYLSQTEPRSYEYVPYFENDIVRWEYLRDRGWDGPLRLREAKHGTKTYARGLCVHSKTKLGYRLSKEYRRFQTAVGISANIKPTVGDARVVISTDGKTLFEATMKGTDALKNLDLDVTDAVMLEILVDYGGDHDIGDRVVFGDAKLIK